MVRRAAGGAGGVGGKAAGGAGRMGANATGAARAAETAGSTPALLEFDRVLAWLAGLTTSPLAHAAALALAPLPELPRARTRLAELADGKGLAETRGPW